MKGIILDYIDGNEFNKLECALKKYNMLAYKKLMFSYYPAIKKGEMLGKVISTNKENNTTTYELELPSDDTFSKIYGSVSLIYTYNSLENVVILERITPEEILIEGHRSELTTYKGVMISKVNQERDMFKIDLLKRLQDK